MLQDSVPSVVHAIQLAVAPVFLLSGIGAMLAVLTNRLGRIMDRARLLESRTATDAAEAGRLRADLVVLSRRARLVNYAITLCTMTALLISAVIAILFVGAFLRFDSALVVALCFVAGMVTLIAGLIVFLREIFLGTANLRIHLHPSTHAARPDEPARPAG